VKALVRYDGNSYSQRTQDMPRPEASTGWVILEVASCGVCGSDVHQWESRLGEKPHPYAVGHEFAGTIVELGDDVTEFAVGDKVASEPFAVWCGQCAMCRAGRVNNCHKHSDMGFGQQGGCAELAAVPARGLHRLPDSIPVEDGAILEPLAVAYNGCFAESRVCPGDFVVVLGCGPVGILSASLALAAGAEVMVTGWTGDDFRLEKARAIGAQHAVNAAEEDALGMVRDLTDPNGPDLIIDAVGGCESFEQAVRMSGMCGQITKIGWWGDGARMNLNAVTGKNLRIHGVYGHTWHVWEKCVRVLAAGHIALEHIVTERLPLSEWERGYRAMQERTAVKVFVLPNG